MRNPFGQFYFADRLLATAERRVALLARCQPKNGRSELARLTELVRNGEAARPYFTYEAVPDLSDLRQQLQTLADRVAISGHIGELYAGRAEELALETRVVEAIATPALSELARRRFRCADPIAEAAAHGRARHWAQLAPIRDEVTCQSHDERDPRSLLNRMQQEIGRRRLGVRVEVCEPMSAAAATGDGVVLVAVGRHLSRGETERIVTHEVLGHALPRHRAASERLRLFALGSARGNDEQEGYALYLEAQHGHLDDRRKRELGLRHLAAHSVHLGADWVETVRTLLTHSASPDEAASIACRAHRAGGLAREAVYLPALHRVETEAARDPAVLDWLGRGRLSLEAIAVLRGTSDFDESTQDETLRAASLSEEVPGIGVNG